MAHTRSLLIFALLLSLGLGGVFLLKKPKEEEVYLVYTAVFEVDTALADTVHVGDTLTDACGKAAAGEVLKVTREDALAEDAFGVYPRHNRTALALTIGGVGVKTEGEARIGTLTPRVGGAVYLLGGARLEGLCVRVRMI